MSRTLAEIYFSELKYDPYVKFACKLFYIDQDKVDAETRSRIKVNLFFIDLENVNLEKNARRLWYHYLNHVIPTCKVENAFRDEDHFYEHYLFMTEDIFYEYAGWYDAVANHM
jgi:hypothetical protein